MTLATPSAAATPATKTDNDDARYQERTFRDENLVEEDYDEFFKIPEIKEPVRSRANDDVMESRKINIKIKKGNMETRKELRQRERQKNGKKDKGRTASKKQNPKPLKLQRIEDRKDKRKITKLSFKKKKPLGMRKKKPSGLKNRGKYEKKNKRRNSIKQTSSPSRVQTRKENRQQARLTKKYHKKRAKGRKPHSKLQHKNGKKDNWHTNKVFSIHQIVRYMLQCQTKTSC